MKKADEIPRIILGLARRLAILSLQMSLRTGFGFGFGSEIKGLISTATNSASILTENRFAKFRLNLNS